MDKKAEISQWLSSIGKDRVWFAAQCGVEKSTADSWFSKRGFPEWALRSIERLMNPASDLSAGLEVTFTASEMDEIDEAKGKVGCPTRRDFYHYAITNMAKRILEKEAAEKGREKVLNFIPPPKTKVAEDPKVYNASSGKGPKT